MLWMQINNSSQIILQLMSKSILFRLFNDWMYVTELIITILNYLCNLDYII